MSSGTFTSHSHFHLNFVIPRRSPGALLARCARSALGPRLRGDDEGAQHLNARVNL
ncbi:hypothetical protein OHM78_03960 [Coxiella burnetii]|nr:hypothetical protein [Coxiella burnetii]UYK70662.1 hypothetical protein OHM78_03960 [Coxiella burnetii]